MGADVCAKDESGRTALHLSSSEGLEEVRRTSAHRPRELCG